MRTAATLGLRVARSSVEQFGDTRAVVVRRYDRIQSRTGAWSRLHQEDTCQALGVRPSRKYESQGGPGAAVVERLINEHSRSEEHTSELQSLMRISYAVFCLNKKTKNTALLRPVSSIYSN